jgi:hypothetical protein
MGKWGFSDRLAIVGIAIGVAMAIAGVALPLAYPDLLTPAEWQTIVWVSISAAVGGVIFLLCDLFAGAKVAGNALFVIVATVFGLAGNFMLGQALAPDLPRGHRDLLP